MARFDGEHAAASDLSNHLRKRAREKRQCARTCDANNVNQMWTYNAAGEITHDTTTSQQYDVVGRLTKTQDANNANIFSTHTFDGDGRQVKFYQQKPDGTTETRYRVYSSVTGKLLTEIDATGQKLETHIYSPNGQHRQMKSWTVYYSGGGSTTYPDTVVGEFSDPHGTRSRQWERQTNTYRDTHIAPIGVPMEAINWQVLKDRFVNGIAAQISYGQAQAVYYPYMRDIVEDPTTPGRGCMLNGQKVSCAKVIKEVNNGRADVDTHQRYSGVVTETRHGRDEHSYITQQIPEGLDGLIVGIDDSGGEQTTKTPCDAVLPSDQTQLALVQLLAHELTPADRVGKNEYRNGDSKGNRTGEKMTSERLRYEALAMASAVRNYAATEDRSVYDVLHDSRYVQDGSGKSASEILEDGSKRVSEAMNSEKGSNPCERLQRAINASTYDYTNPVSGVHGSILPIGYRWWKAVVQSPIRQQNSLNADIRFGDTDFTTYWGGPPKAR